MAIASIELCFNCNGSSESRGQTGSGVDCDGRRLMVAAVVAVSGCMPPKFGWRTGLQRRMADRMMLLFVVCISKYGRWVIFLATYLYLPITRLREYSDRI